MGTYSLPELVIGGQPFSFGSWFTPIADNWEDPMGPFPQDYWITILYDIPAEDEGQRSGRARLTGADMIAAAQRIERGEVNLSSEYVKEIVCALHDADQADIDAIGADAVLQVAVYGEVVYG